MDENLKTGIETFIYNLKNETVNKKKRYHFKSTINIANGICKSKNKESLELKKVLNNYFKELDYNKLSQFESIKNYKEYIFPVGLYLIRNKQFITRTDIFINIFLGITIDIIIYYFFNQNHIYPAFLLIFLIIGLVRRKIKIKNSKYFSPNW